MNIRHYLKKVYVTLLQLLNSKNNYRFFLKSSFTAIDSQITAQLATTNVFGKHIERASIKAPFGRNVVVIAPHQDDEAVGCGGALLLHVATGRPVYPIFVQNGVGDPDSISDEKQQEIIEIRENEAREAARIGGFQTPQFLRHARLSLATLEPVVESLVDSLNRTKPDTIFTPFLLDPDNDHTVCNIALALALKQTGIKCQVMGYEIWSLCIANVGVAIDSVIEGKQAIISAYKSQLASTDYLNTTIGLNMFNSRVFSEPDTHYVENYFELPSTEFISIVDNMRQARWPE